MMAEFATPGDLVAAAEAARSAGYRRMDAFTPFPIERLSEALGHRPSRVPMLVLVGGIIGALAGYGLQYWVSAVAYPPNLGGPPYNSWPAVHPINLELTILIPRIFTGLRKLALDRPPA